MLNNVWTSTISTVASLTGAQILAGTSPDAFASWPLSAQASFVRAYATTPSGAVLIGSSGNQAVATLAASGEVLLSPVPANFNSTPDGVDYNSFTSWSEDLQSFYVRANGSPSGAAATATLGAPGRQFTATVPAGGGAVSVAASAGLLAAYTGGTTPTPASLTASAFFALPEDEQKLLAARNGSPLTLAGAGADAQAISVRLADATSFTVRVPAGTYPGFGDALDTSNTAGVAISDATAFRSWPAEVQKSYLSTVAGASGYPLALVFGVAAEEVPAGASAASTASDGFTALLAAADAAVVVSDNPSGFGQTLTGFAAASSAFKAVTRTPAPVADAFLAWPAAAQVAYVRAQGGSVALAGTPSGTLTAAVSSPAGLTLAVAAPTTYPAPADLDLDLFALWPASDQTKYITAEGSGSPASLTVTNAAGTALLTANGTKAATVEVAPAGYASKPADLAPSTFLSWGDGWRRAYVAKNGGDVTMGGHLLTIGSDLQQIQVAFAGGQLQFTTPSLIDLSPSDLAPPTGAEIAASTSTSAFAAWSMAAKASFIRTNGVGTPPSVLIGAPGDQQIWSIDKAGNYTITTIPSKALTVNADPAGIALSDVEGWPVEAQVYYILTHQTDKPLVLGSGASPPPLTLSSDGKTVTSNGTPVKAATSSNTKGKIDSSSLSLADLLTQNPTAVDPDKFAGVSAADQAAYFAAKATGTPPTLTIGSGTPGQTASITLLTMVAGAVVAQPVPVGFDATPVALPAATFLSWTADVRRLYVQREAAAQASAGTAAQVVIGTDTTITAALGSDGQVGVSLPIPYETLGDTTDTSTAATAALLFPLQNGGSAAGTPLARPAGFYSPPASLDPKAFTQWSSADQAAYIRLNASSPLGPLTIGSGTNTTPIDAFVQSDPPPGALTKVYVVQSLQKTDIVNLSYADQKTLAGIASFKAIASGFGLLIDANLSSMEPGVDTNSIKSAADFVQQLLSTERNGTGGSGGITHSQMDSADQAVFTSEIDLLWSQLLGTKAPTGADSSGNVLTSPDATPSYSAARTSGSAIFSVADIQAQITAIDQRFKRAEAFYEQIKVSGTTASMADGDSSIKNAYNTFMISEKSILQSALSSNRLANSGRTDNSTLDLDIPNLIALFQIYSSASQQAIIKADTEEVNQVNAVLQDYSAMQQIINNTLAQFPASTGSDAPSKKIIGNGSNGDFQGNDNDIMHMFDSYSPKNTSPIEELAGINNRPRLSIYKPDSSSDSSKPNNDAGCITDAQQSNFYSDYAQNLNGAVTTLNQQSQIKMNDITSENKMLDRYTQLASDVLSKANDMVSKIASAG